MINRWNRIGDGAVILTDDTEYDSILQSFKMNLYIQIIEFRLHGSRSFPSTQDVNPLYTAVSPLLTYFKQFIIMVDV